MNQSNETKPERNVGELIIAIAFLIFLLIMFRIWHGKPNPPLVESELITHEATPTEMPAPSGSTLQHEPKPGLEKLNSIKQTVPPPVISEGNDVIVKKDSSLK